MYSRNWYLNLKKSKLTPPDYIFGIVWPILYFTLIIFFLLLVKNKKCLGICAPLIPFLGQLVLNFMWSPVFFRMQKPRISFLIIVGMIILTSYTFILSYQIKKKN